MKPRYSCPECWCEVGFGAKPHEAIAHVLADEQETGNRTHSPIDGEPPLAFDPECLCRCHAAWRTWFRKGVAT